MTDTIPPPPPGYVLQPAPVDTMAVAHPAGLIAPGNIDLSKRPIVRNADGSYSTVRSISIDQDGRSYLIPTVVDGQVVSNDDAIKHFQQTGENLGQFKTWQDADAYAKTLHDQQAAEYDQQAAASIPPPPPGYVLQPPAGASQGAQPPQGNQGAPRSFLENLGRAAAMTGRDVVQGALALPEMLHDALVRTPYNAVAQAIGSDSRIAPGADQIDSLLNRVGVPNPQPENGVERVVGNIDKGIGSVLGGAGLGSVLAKSGNAAVSGLGSVLADRVGAQAASAATGAGAASVAKEADASPAVQLGAGVLGGFAPSVSQATFAATLRGLLRGGENGRQAVADNLKSFEAAGTTPTVGQATQRRALQGVESMLAKTPGAAGVMDSAAQRQAQEAAQGIDSIADRLSTIRDPAGAGRKIERGISGPGGFIDRFRQESGALYDKLDQFIPADQRVDVANTLKVLPELNPTIPGAPATSKFFQNAKIKGIEGALESDINNPEASLSRPEVQQKAQALGQAMESNNAAVEASNQAGQAAIDQANAMRVGTPAKTFTPDEPLTPEEMEANIRELASSMSDGKLPYEAVKKLRTLVGNEMNNNSLVSDVPRSKWTALYAALSKDLQGAAQEAGPNAQRAWSRANAYYKAGQERIGTIANVVDKAGGPEAVFNAATSGARDGATTLRAVMKSLQPDERKVLASVMVRKLGRATPGQQNAAGDAFSMSSFLTNWNRLSPDARNTLFGRFGPQFSQDMDHLAQMAENVRTGSKVFSNPSGTAASSASIAAWVSALSSLVSGHPGGAAAVAGAAGASNLTARLMTNRWFVHWLADQTRLNLAPQQANWSNLYNMARTHDDPDLKTVADLLRQPRVQEQGNEANEANNASEKP